MVSWGTNPQQTIGIGERVPDDAERRPLDYMELEAGQRSPEPRSRLPSSAAAPIAAFLISVAPPPCCRADAWQRE
jgi:hypothetical protein